MRNPFKTLRIDFVFFFGFAFIVTLLVGVVVWISYSSSSKEIASNTSHYQQKLLGELNKKLTTSLVGIEQSSNTASKNFDVTYNRFQAGTKYDKVRAQAEIRSQLNNYVFNTPILHSIHVYSVLPLNYSLQEYVQFLPFEQMKEETWYPLIDKTDDAWISEHTIRTNSGDIPVISFARKVYNNLNQYYALMVLNIKVPVFQALIETEGGRSSVALLDETGQLITQTVNEAFSQEQLDGIAAEIERNAAGSKRTGDEFLVWSKSIDSKWTLIERTSWKDMTASSLQITRLFLLLGIAAIFLILLLGVLVARQFMKPIGLLLKAMSNYSPQKQDALPDDYKNEFGRLFQGYQKLMQRIEELYGNLEVQYEKRREAEIKSLQVMINPHFLYNSLDQVNWVAITAGQSKISAMLSQLGQLFRLALSNTGRLVPLSEELAHIECYLQFQKVRWEDRLEYRIEADEEALRLRVPKIILQPFIENAFVHGFHGRRSAKLTVAIRPADGHLEIAIADDGRGLRAAASESRSAKGGYGLRNVKERIEALFGPSYGFELVPGETGGTRAIVRLPIIEEQTQEEDA
ncbi:sensor with HAMP domain protein [Cohnella sp. CIP 111063]|uniref:cache domain-containing sensor histidine kinase n=1 Tax=unclassified Cohnella TaxID=2636738 RepID=UPI000B8C14C0|nr:MULTISPECIES: sensor histidine kinase [unclassified Cohnella]OXS54435.1 sensor with HAMP domain protein [Cohnella sp. CIP 111063]PRX63931.1 two-component system sensor histidine kinase YesM [Cohnella sp. SGD-V74]